MLRLVIALFVLSLASGAHAQSGQTRAEARQSFQAGERAFESNDNEEALRHFKRAFELYPSDVVRFNIGVCLERLGRNREAMLEYELAAASTDLDDETRARAESDASRARARLGTLAVEGEPQGATVVVDGEELCTLPCEVAVDAGPHDVVVRDGDRESSHRPRVARGGRTTVTAELAAQETEVEEETEPEVVESELESRGPGALTWIGAGTAVLGGAGIVIFGLMAQSLHDDYVAMPDADTRDEGMLMRNLANASIGVAALGAVLVLVDLIFLSPKQVEREDVALRMGADGVRLVF